MSVGTTWRKALWIDKSKSLGIIVGLIWTNAVEFLWVTERVWSWTGVKTLVFLTQSAPVLT